MIGLPLYTSVLFEHFTCCLQWQPGMHRASNEIQSYKGVAQLFEKVLKDNVGLFNEVFEQRREFEIRAYDKGIM